MVLDIHTILTTKPNQDDLCRPALLHLLARTGLLLVATLLSQNTASWLTLLCLGTSCFALLGYVFCRYQPLHRQPYWLLAAADMGVLTLLVASTGAVQGFVSHLGYLWFFGALLFYLPHSPGYRTLLVLAALPFGAQLLGSSQGEGWGAQSALHALGFGVAVLLGQRLVDEYAKTHLDPLSCVAQRRYGVARLEQLLELGQPFQLTFLDLHGFKTINDRYGHMVGDEIICTVGARLRSATRSGDLVMRFGGDEFVVASSAPALRQRLQAALHQPARTSVGEINLEVDLGEVSWQPGEPLTALLGRADAAMYAHKNQRKARAALVQQTKSDGAALAGSENTKRVGRYAQAADNPSILHVALPGGL